MSRFEFAEFKGNSAEVKILLAALSALRYNLRYSGQRMDMAERTAFANVYDRLIWCDHLTISFHAKALDP